MTGFATFIPKLFEYNYRQKASSSGSYSGLAKAVGSAIGNTCRKPSHFFTFKLGGSAAGNKIYVEDHTQSSALTYLGGSPTSNICRIPSHFFTTNQWWAKLQL
jgi:hypothetical protein